MPLSTPQSVVCIQARLAHRLQTNSALDPFACGHYSEPGKSDDAYATYSMPVPALRVAFSLYLVAILI